MKRTRLNRQPKRIKGLKLKSWISIVITIVFTFSLTTPFYIKGTLEKAHAYSNVDLIAHKPTVAGESATVATEQEQISEYIKEVFGSDADKAFLVLSCENKALNPNAVNTVGNEPAGSRDIGVFQINEYWQRTQGKFLFNWKVNVEIAHQLFEENGKSFKLWTCGRKLNV